MRKLTPEERAAKKAGGWAAPAEHTHTADCGHEVAEVAEDKPKRKKKSAEEVPAEESVAALADTPAEEVPAEEVPAEESVPAE